MKCLKCLAKYCLRVEVLVNRYKVVRYNGQNVRLVEEKKKACGILLEMNVSVKEGRIKR